MRVRAAVGAVAAALLAAGCADASPSASSPSETRNSHGEATTSAIPARSPVRPAPSATTATSGSLPRITVRRSGGLAGIEQTLAVRPDGLWVWGGMDQGAVDQRGAPRSGRLTAPQRTELARLARLPALAAEARRKPGPPQCADGFNYALTVGSLRVSWVDCDPVRPPTAVAITNLLAAATPL